MDPDLLVHVADVGVHRVGGDDELLRHVVRREAARNEHDDFRLAGGKREFPRQFLDALLLKRFGCRRRHELGDVVFLADERDDDRREDADEDDCRGGGCLESERRVRLVDQGKRVARRDSETDERPAEPERDSDGHIAFHSQNAEVHDEQHLEDGDDRQYEEERGNIELLAGDEQGERDDCQDDKPGEDAVDVEALLR